MGRASDLVEANFSRGTTNQKHYPGLAIGSDTPSVTMDSEFLQSLLRRNADKPIVVHFLKLGEVCPISAVVNQCSRHTTDTAAV